MSGWLRLCLAIYWIGLSLWIAALVAAAVAAMAVFGTLPDMTLSAERFEAYPAAEHGALVAGIVMADVFFGADLIQFVAVPMTVFAAAIQVVMIGDARRPAGLIRYGCILVAAIGFGLYAFRMAPELNAQLRQAWAAAEMGDIATADRLRESFRKGHGAARTILQLNLVLLLLAVVSSAIALAPARSRPTLEPPELARR